MGKPHTSGRRTRRFVGAIAAVAALATSGFVDTASVRAIELFDPTGEERVEALLHENYLFGHGWADDHGDVEITVYDAPSGVELNSFTKTPSEEAWVVDLFELGATRLAPGMFVVVEDADDNPDVTKELVIADLTITSINPTTDIVTGTAPPDALERNAVDIDLGEAGVADSTRTVVPAPDGTWSLDAAPFGIGVDSTFEIRLEEFEPLDDGGADGDATRIRRGPRIGVSDRGVGGDRWFIEQNMKVEVFADPDDIPGSLLGDVTITPESDGSFFVPTEAFSGEFAIEPGMVVVATDLVHDNVKTVLAESAAVVDIDTETRTLRGVAPPNVEIEAVAYLDSTDQTRQKVMTADDGRWTAVFDEEIIFHADTHVVVSEYDADGIGGLDVDASVWFYRSPDYVGLDPFRLLDSRPGDLNVGPFDSPWGPDTSRSVKVVGGAVPTDASAVAINITAVRPSELSFLTIHPTGSDRPTAASLNFAGGVVRNDLVIAKVGDDGMIDIYNASGTVDLVIDVVGYFSPLAGVGYEGLDPFRLVDSRPGDTNVGPFSTPWASDTTRSIDVTGDLVPDDATAVALHITAVRPSELSFLTVSPTGTERPTVAALNFAGGVVRNDLVIAKVGDDGMVDIYNASGTVDLVIDVVGHFSPGIDRGYEALTPFRLLDSRPGDTNVGPFSTPWTADSTRSVDVAATGQVPDQASAVILNVTAVRPSELSFLTVFTTDTPMRPTAASLNFAAGVVRNDVVIAKLVEGKVEVYNASGNVDLVIDVAGYITGA